VSEVKVTRRKQQGDVHLARLLEPRQVVEIHSLLPFGVPAQDGIVVSARQLADSQRDLTKAYVPCNHDEDPSHSVQNEEVPKLGVGGNIFVEA
jgi:hypothetical protein